MNPRVLFLFSGASDRDILREQVARGENADTGLRGSNYVPNADTLDVARSVQAMIPAWLYRLLPWSARSILLFHRVMRYDVVIAQDDVLLGLVVSWSARVFGTRTRWVGLAINSSVLIKRHRKHVLRCVFLKLCWTSFARIICLSTAQREDLVGIGVPRENVVFVPFGVDTEFFAKSKGQEEEGLVVSVGRDLGRDYATLIKVVENSPYRFTIVAEPKNFPHGIPQLPNLTVQYHLPLIEIRALYTRAQLVVVVSKDADTNDGTDCSGQTVILDALAAGKAVVATARPWITDYFVPGQDLVVVAPQDPVALANAIEKLLANSDARTGVARAGQAKVRERYTTRAFAQALERVVQDIHV